MAALTNLVISSDDLRCLRNGSSPDIEENARILAELMSPPERAVALRGGVGLKVMGKPTDPEVQGYFSALHAIWPLWLHFIARDDSLEFLVRALYADQDTGDIDQDDLKRFIDHSIPEIADYYVAYEVPLDARQLERECLQYFRQRGLIHTDA